MFSSSHDPNAHDETQDSPLATTDPASATMPLLGSVAGDDEGLDPLAFDSAEENKRIATQSAILIAIVALIAGGVLLGMRIMVGGTTASASSEQITKINTFIQQAQAPADPAKATGGTDLRTMLADADAIVSKIATQYPEKAVPLTDIQKNPFELSFITQATGQAEVTVDVAERQRVEKLRILQREFDQLELQSIMGSGRRSVAMIDNEFYRVGQRVGSFRLAGIQAGRVALIPADLQMRPNDPRFILDIQAEANAANARR